MERKSSRHALTRRGRAALLSLWFASILLLSGCGGENPAAETIYVNGLVWTGGTSPAWAEALAVADDRILSVGTESAIRDLSGPTTTVVDLQGRLVIPGFNDAHTHFLALERAELQDSTSLEDLQKRLVDFASQRLDNAWVEGRGWVYTVFPERTPHRRYLDQVLMDRPVLIRDRDGHAALANSAALELAGINKATPDPTDGEIVRDSDGDPTGLLKEAAMSLVSRHIPPPSGEELYQTLLRRLGEAASFGITSVQNASRIDLEVWERLLNEGKLTVRVAAAVPFEQDVTAQDLAYYKELRSRHRGPWIKFGMAKGMVDGTVDSKTAAMFEPYVGGGEGLPMWSQEELDASVAFYEREGFQILLHAIGDRAIHMALNAFESAARQNQTSGRRHRIEHIEVPALDDLPRFRQLGVIASTQAIFANPDEATLGNYAPLLGPERASRSNAFRLFDEAGAVQAFGSDWPVFPMDPLQGMRIAVTRMTSDHQPEGGWYPENCISVEDALRHYTVDSAYAEFAEDSKGTLEAGKLADFAVLSENILESPPEALLRTRVLMTVVGGRVSFQSPEF